MRALEFREEIVYREDMRRPRPADGEALIRVRYAGICNTDLEITRGYMGFKGVPGHEFAGVVERCDETALTGKRVTGEINISCSECTYCKNGMRSHCPERSILGILNRDGAFSEYITLPAENLHVIPDSVTDEEAVFIEPVAAAYEVLRQVDISASDRVCVLGDGKLGLLVAQVLASTGCDLVTVGRHASKLGLLDEMGIHTETLERFSGGGFDLAVDCTGSGSGITMAVNIVRPRGKVVLKTTVADKGGLDLNQPVINEITIVGSRCGPFPEAIEAIASGKVRVRPLISALYELRDGVRAFRHASEKGVIKVILKIP